MTAPSHATCRRWGLDIPCCSSLPLPTGAAEHPHLPRTGADGWSCGTDARAGRARAARARGCRICHICHIFEDFRSQHITLVANFSSVALMKCSCHIMHCDRTLQTGISSTEFDQLSVESSGVLYSRSWPRPRASGTSLIRARPTCASATDPCP